MNEESQIAEETIDNDSIAKKDCNNEESKIKGTAEEIEENKKSPSNNN